MLFTEFKKHLATGQYKSCYLIIGDDPYVTRRAADMLVSKVSAYPELNVSVMGERSTADDVTAACMQLPFMGALRVVDAGACRFDTQPLVKYLSDPSPSTVLFFVAEKAEKYLLPIMKRVEVVDCNKLSPEVIKSWLAREAAAAGSQIKESAAELLIEYCNRNMARISTELPKLAAFKADGIIEPEDVRALVSPETEYKIYELSDAVASKNPDRALSILTTLMAENNSPAALLSMVYGHFRRLFYALITSDGENLPKYLGVKEYAVKMSQRQAKLYSPKRLKRIVDNLHRADADFKAGRISDRLALETFITQTLLEG